MVEREICYFVHVFAYRCNKGAHQATRPWRKTERDLLGFLLFLCLFLFLELFGLLLMVSLYQ